MCVIMVFLMTEADTGQGRTVSLESIVGTGLLSRTTWDNNTEQKIPHIHTKSLPLCKTVNDRTEKSG